MGPFQNVTVGTLLLSQFHNLSQKGKAREGLCCCGPHSDNSAGDLNKKCVSRHWYHEGQGFVVVVVVVEMLAVVRE